MRLDYPVTRVVFAVLLIIGLLSLSGAPVEANELEVSYSQQIVENAHYYYSLQFQHTLDLGPQSWLKSELGLGDLMDFEHSVISLDLGAYRRFTEYPKYAVGLSYRYLFDRRSFFNGVGGRLKEHELAFRVLGTVNFGKTRIDTELSYAPLGAYKFMNDLYRPLGAFRFSVGAVIPFSEYWNLTVKAMQGNQSYMAESRPAAMYRVGLTYEFH